MKQIYLLLSCIVLLLCACEFEPSGSHFEEVNPVPDNTVSITLGEATDTIFAKGPVTYALQLALPGKALRGYQVLLDDQVIGGEDLHENSVLYINTNKYKDGVHELKVLVESSTGTNSLADKAGYENMQVYRTWVLVIDNASPSPVSITKLAVEDGAIKLEWEKYKRRYIKNYVVKRHYPNGGTVYYATLSPDSTAWEDPNFIGGTGYYSVTVVDTYGLTAESEKKTITVPSPELLSYKYVNGNDLQLTFSACRLYKNFGKYKLRYSAFNQLEELYETETVTDTVLTLQDLGFGTDFNLFLNTDAKAPAQSWYGTSNAFTVDGYSKENTTGDFNIAYHNPQSGLFYDLHGETMKVIDDQTLAVRHERVSASYNARALSANGQHLYLQEINGQVLKLDPHTLETAETYRLQELVPGISYNEVRFQVSNTNKLLVFTHNYYANDTLYVVDMNTRQLELKHGQQNYSYSQSASISPDGNMVTAYNYVFRKQANGSWSKVQVSPGLYSNVTYHPTQPLYYLGGRSTVTFYRTENDAVVNSLVLGDGVYPSRIDKATGYLVASGNWHLYIYDLATKQVLKDIKLAYGHSGVAFFKDRLFTRNYYLPITF